MDARQLFGNGQKAYYLLFPDTLLRSMLSGKIKVYFFKILSIE
uniref:Uncharacterized protein n=1 Tax=uncultured Desulfobacterium sp. TaxID=201089 RepID=E1YC28_9BACT|nr:unknown protein [uncultured Desulfobacterium sp.]